MTRKELLEEELHKHQELYNVGTPEISDAEFDALQDELRELVRGLT